MNKAFLKTFPLKSLNLTEAITLQHYIVTTIAKNFSGQESLNLGDLGVSKPDNKPNTTCQVEKIIAQIFKTEAALLVTGAGTGALRWGIYGCTSVNKKVLVHDAPIYPTTKTSLEFANFEIIKANFNDLDAIKNILKQHPDIPFAIVQYTRQKLDDNYDYAKVIQTLKKCNKTIKIMTDDNYAVFKTGNIGTDFGADIATFSGFKILGPVGIGVIVGKKAIISKIAKENYSGGSQVQGFQAMALLRAMVNAPVALAIQANVVQQTYEALKKQKIAEIAKVYIANAQSKVLIIQFNQPIAEKVLANAEKLGALPHPVGAESKYEITPLFYRVSGTFSQSLPEAKKYFIRINPNRGGVNLILDILTRAIAKGKR